MSVEKTPDEILKDWEYQATEMDFRNPTRAQIMGEAAILRRAISASDARVEAAVRAGLERAAMKCDAARDFRNEQRRKNSGEHRDWLQRWAAGAMQADLLAVTIRALAADPAAVARIARGLAP